MLEDESGRIRLVGQCLNDANLVTGVIIGVLGIENNDGDFDVLDICYPGMAPHFDLVPEFEDEEVKHDWLRQNRGAPIF